LQAAAGGVERRVKGIGKGTCGAGKQRKIELGEKN